MSRRTPRSVTVISLACSALALGSLPAVADSSGTSDHAGLATWRAPETLVPIGGGYESPALRSYSLRVAQQARGATVDIVIVPSSYGDAPEDRADNLRLAGERTAQIEAECDAALAASVPRTRFTDCRATLAPLLSRDDAMDPANAAGFSDSETDGVFVLGGDQVLAMHVLANTPAEQAMEAAYHRGVVVGGTSAGNAVESRTMGAGYTEDGYPENGMERDAALLFFGDDLASQERGLSFGSDRAILDQHFYQRGRMGRLLAYVARSRQHYGFPGKLGVGVDWATGLSIENDNRLTQPFGYSSSTVLDMSSASAPQWVGPRQTLSVRGVRALLVAPLADRSVSYEMPTRTLRLGAERVPNAAPQALPALTATGGAPLVLGGGQNAADTARGLRPFVRSLRDGGPVTLVLAGYADSGARDAAAAAYTAALRREGWAGPVQVIRHGLDRIRPAGIAATSAGVLLVGDDQSRMASFVTDTTVRRMTQQVRAAGRPLMTDGAATATAGQVYVTNRDPQKVSESPEAIAMFQSHDARLATGLGLVEGYAFEPELTQDFRWGRLFDIGAQRRSVVGAGISERTAVVVTAAGARVHGERSLVTVDGRQATWRTASNGSLTGANAFISTFGPGDHVR